MPNVMPLTAIVVNPSARGVTQPMLEYIRQSIPDHSRIKLYVSQSLEQAKEHAKKIVNRRIEVVLSGGGDGTLARVISDIMELKPEQAPAFGVLQLGTGNSMAAALKCRPLHTGIFGNGGFAEELAQISNPDARIRHTMLRIGQKYAPFAGIGLSAWVLRDYNLAKKILDIMPPLRVKWRGPWDYLLGITFGTAPKFAITPLPEVIIRNTKKGISYQMDYEGHPLYEFPEGAILYRGPASFIAASIILYYGFGMRLFHQANSLPGGFFQLRISKLDFWLTFKNILPAISGMLENEGVLDFACNDIEIQVLPTPDMPQNKTHKELYERAYKHGVLSEISGDIIGCQQKMTISAEEFTMILGSRMPPKSTA